MLKRCLIPSLLLASVSLGALGLANAAKADDFYHPYYMVQRDQYQYADFAPPVGQPIVAPSDQAADDRRRYTTPPVQLAPAPTPADTVYYPQGIQTIRNDDKAIWGAVGEDFLNYKESLPPPTDGERGWLPSFDGGVSYITEDNWYGALDTSFALGNAHYYGAVTNINTHVTTPYDGWTVETSIDVDGKVGKGFVAADNLLLTPYIDLGLHYWGRDLKGPGGYVEEYAHYDALGGLMAQIAPTDRLVLTGYGSYGTTFGASMNTQGTHLPLGSAGAYKVGGKVEYSITQHFGLFSTIDFSHFRYVQSGLKPDYQIGYYIYEPSSFNNQTTARAGVAYHFE